MEKKVIYKGKEYKIKIQWSGSTYVVLAYSGIFIDGKEKVGSEGIPSEVWVSGAYYKTDIGRIIPYIKKALDNVLENKHDLKAIEEWDGDLDYEL